MKVYSVGADGYREPLWQVTEEFDCYGEWWKGQVKINDHQVRNTMHEHAYQ